SDGSSGVELNAHKTLDLLALDGVYSIVGRSVVVHAGADSCAGAAGDAGAKAVSGVIALANEPGNAAGQEAGGISAAVCRLRADEGCPLCAGAFYFSRVGAAVRVQGRVQGLPARRAHGLRIHTFGYPLDAL